MKGGFLDRLRTGVPRLDEANAIVAHLRALLNARQGESQTVPDYGLPDFTDIARRLPEGVDIVERSIADVVAKYEPRLCKVQVRFVPSDGPFRLQFEVSARHSGDRAKRFRVKTQMTQAGRFKVGG